MNTGIYIKRKQSSFLSPRWKTAPKQNLSLAIPPAYWLGQRRYVVLILWRAAFNSVTFNQSYIKEETVNFIEDEELIFNIQNQNKNNEINTSLNFPNPNNNKSHGSSIKTNATFGENSKKSNEDFSFFSLNNYQNQDVNIPEKKKELTKESIEILNNFISKEKLVISNGINDGQNIFKNNNISVKDIKNNLFNIENKLYVYFKKPYMRKNVKIKKNIVIKKNFDEEEQVEDEDKKIKFGENDIKMEDIKDDDSKTNNDSCEEINTDYDKKKYP